MRAGAAAHGAIPRPARTYRQCPHDGVRAHARHAGHRARRECGWTSCKTAHRPAGAPGVQAGLTCLSHDIRTPLAGAQGYLQLVEDEADPAEGALLERRRPSAGRRAGAAGRPVLVRPGARSVVRGGVRAGASGRRAGRRAGGLYPQFRERGWSRACCWTTRRSCRPMPSARASSAT
ncbi:MAG: histidine kinase dimerization/phospho-acceptor domain-containing protein [Eggerthella lenta]